MIELKSPNPKKHFSLWLLLSFITFSTIVGQEAPTREQILTGFHRTGLNTTPEDARLLKMLIKIHHAKRGVEIGSATGYGAVNMGLAFEQTGGKLWTIDIDPAMVEASQKVINEMKLAQTVTCVEGDALKVIPALEGPFDFIFIDAMKSDYGKYLAVVEPKLASEAVIVADNTIQYASSMKDFFERISNNRFYEMVTVQASKEKGDGMTIIFKSKRK
jgi:caffeoyl-CoA O-methyltransferase